MACKKDQITLCYLIFFYTNNKTLYFSTRFWGIYIFKKDYI